MEQKTDSVFETPDDIDGHVQDAFDKDQVEKSKVSPELKSVFSEKECLMLNCSLKANYEVQKKQIKELQREKRELTEKIELMHKAVTTDASEDNIKKALHAAVRDKILQAMKEDIQRLNNSVINRDKKVAALERNIRHARDEVKGYEVMLKTDEVLHEKFNNMKLLEERALQLQAHVEELTGKRFSAEEKASAAEVMLRKVRAELDHATKKLAHKKRHCCPK